jgi:shikimate kinase
LSAVTRFWTFIPAGSSSTDRRAVALWRKDDTRDRSPSLAGRRPSPRPKDLTTLNRGAVADNAVVLIVITGPIASGKSSVARSLAVEAERRGTDTAAIDMDIVYDMLEQRGGRKDDSSKWARTRRVSAAFADRLLADGVGVVIVEGELLTPSDRREFLRALRSPHSPRFVTLRVSFEHALRRVNSDATRRFSRDPEFLRRHHESVQKDLAAARPGELSLDTESTSPDEVAHVIADWARPGSF